MKTNFNFGPPRVTNGEILPSAEQILPGTGARYAGGLGIFLSEMKHLPGFQGYFCFSAEKSTMAQPLLKGGLQ
jgi:hypothetical protein